MSIRCTNCGAAVTEDSKFCKYCGAKLEEDNIQKIEIDGNIKQNITHRFAFSSEARLKKIEAKAELEKERLRQQTLQAEIERQKAKEEAEIARQKAKEEHERLMRKIPIYFILGIFAFIGLIILMTIGKSK